MDNSVGLASKEEELASLLQNPDRTSTAYGMEVKLLANKSEGIKRDNEVNGQKFKVVNSFKYLGAVVTDKGSKPEVMSRTVQASAALARLIIIWRDKKKFSKIQNQTDVLTCNINFPICL